MQLDYAQCRLRDAYQDLLGDGPDNDNGRAEYRADAEMIRTGKVKITQTLVNKALEGFDLSVRTDKRWHKSFCECLTVFVEGAIDKKRQPACDKAQKIYNARAKKLRAKYLIAKDELILGDAEKALKLIEAFRKTKV